MPNSSPLRWQPLLSGNEASRALEVAREIFDELLARAAVSPVAPGCESAMLALSFAYAAHQWPNTDYRDLALTEVERASDALAEANKGPALYGGFSGVAWVCEHLRGRLLDEAEDANEEIDEALLELLDVETWAYPYDLIAGLVGYGVYALERYPRGATKICLEKVLSHLERLAVRTPAGLAWHTPPALLTETQLREWPQGHYNLGMAHGIPGVISFLSQVLCLCESLAPRAGLLLEGAVAWLLGQRASGDEYWFPHLVSAAQPMQPSRLAWCYGDPGCAIALLAAARALDSPQIEATALAVARCASRRPEQLSGVQDAGLCHGASGLALVFGRMSQVARDDALREAASLWTRRALEMRQPGSGIAGYRTHIWDEKRGAMDWEGSDSFLTGVGGIALALLSAATEVSPDWDSLLLTRPPADR